MTSSIRSVIITKGHRNGQATLKQALLSITVGETVRIIHTDFYCRGIGGKCRLPHLITELKEEGNGRWSSKHFGIGIALVTRKK